MGGFQGANQNRTGGAFFFANEVHAPVDAVGAIDVKKTRRTEHYHRSWCWPVIGVGRRLRMVIRLNLDNDAPDAIDEQCRADQIGRNFMYAAPEELAR